MNNVLDYIVFNNSVKDWLIAAAIIVVALVLLRVFQSVLIKRLKLFTARTKTTIDDFIVSVVHASVMPLMYVLAFYLGLQYLSFTPGVNNVLRIAIMVVSAFFILRAISSFISYVFTRALLKHGNIEQRKKQSRGILLIFHIAVWLIGFLFLVENLGYDITTVVAGLGIGGIAIALAAQTILGDLFSYFVIFFDRPFEIGDFIIVDDKMGTVEYVGIKTTRLRTLSGEQLVCSNTDLTNSRVHNFKRMQERRIAFSFGLVYATPVEKLSSIPGQIKRIIEGLGELRFDRAHFKSFGNFSLDFEVVYYVLSADYNFYMDKQQAINLKLFELFQSEGIEFAFPTQTIFMSRVDQEQPYHN